jgi:cold shock CspA family protein
MIQTGYLKFWKPDRDFGFLRDERTGIETFVHVSAFKDAVIEPRAGSTYEYCILNERDGRTKAVGLRLI